jgi:antitoxin component of MazEF toxin-antitoxin module
MPREYVLKRRVIKLGRSLVISLPKVWSDAVNLTEGQDVYVAFDAYDHLKVIPPRALKNEAR